jgi:hypothetical protein
MAAAKLPRLLRSLGIETRGAAAANGPTAVSTSADYFVICFE